VPSSGFHIKSFSKLAFAVKIIWKNCTDPKELLLFGGFFADFDLDNLNQHSWADYSQLFTRERIITSRDSLKIQTSVFFFGKQYPWAP
jgi:hypothetical protein